jgi:hypothetical protein
VCSKSICQNVHLSRNLKFALYLSDSGDEYEFKVNFKERKISKVILASINFFRIIIPLQ